LKGEFKFTAYKFILMTSEALILQGTDWLMSI